MKRLLVACEFSGIVRDAFAAKGWDAWSCDLLPTERPGNHYQDDIISVLRFGPKNWDLMIAHPPCTYLTNAGVQHLHDHVTSVNRVKAKINGAARFEESWRCFWKGYRLIDHKHYEQTKDKTIEMAERRTEERHAK